MHFTGELSKAYILYGELSNTYILHGELSNACILHGELSNACILHGEICIPKAWYICTTYESLTVADIFLGQEIRGIIT